MKLWIDGDSCPRGALNAALAFQRRGKLNVLIAADRELPGVRSSGACLRVVSPSENAADNIIVQGSAAGDLALTRDLALALRLLNKGVQVISDRGEIRSKKELLQRQEDAQLMKLMREGGIAFSLPERYSRSDAQAFSQALERILIQNRM